MFRILRTNPECLYRLLSSYGVLITLQQSLLSACTFPHNFWRYHVTSYVSVYKQHELNISSRLERMSQELRILWNNKLECFFRSLFPLTIQSLSLSYAVYDHLSPSPPHQTEHHSSVLNSSILNCSVLLNYKEYILPQILLIFNNHEIPRH
jgi:hypothetical protein